MNLYLIRHGECDGPEKPDAERAPTVSGLEDIEKMASYVTSMFPKPQKIICSPFQRAIQTAEFFQTGWGAPLETSGSLLPASPPSQILTELEGTKIEDVALVGHLPHLGILLGDLVWGAPAKEVVISRGAAAYLLLKELKPGSAKLKWLLTPDTLD